MSDGEIDISKYPDRTGYYGVDEAPDYGPDTDPASYRYKPLYDYALVAYQKLDEADKAIVREFCLSVLRRLLPDFKHPLKVQRLLAIRHCVYVSSPTIRKKWYEVIEQEARERTEEASE